MYSSKLTPIHLASWLVLRKQCEPQSNPTCAAEAAVGGYDIGPGWFYTFLLRIYDILYGEKHGNLHSLGISLDLSYSLYGHSQPYSQRAAFSLIWSLAPSLYRSLGSNNITNESAVGLVLPTEVEMSQEHRIGNSIAKGCGGV